MINLNFQKLHETFIYIETNEALAALCKKCLTLPYITLDTEFVRTKTLYPLLGLVQIFDGKAVYLIDPVKITDIAPLAKLLTDESTLKVLHSCSEDLDALKHNVGEYPSPLFDTQVAAGFLDMGNSIGYANLVENICDVTLDKTESRTDWLARPLRQEQLMYAAADVTYLHIVYAELFNAVEEKQLTKAVLLEAQNMTDKKQYAIPSDYAYMTIGNNWKLAPKNLLALKLLAKWRVETAQDNNTSINFVLRESCMLDIAARLPRNLSLLGKVHGISPKQNRLYGKVILSIVDDVENATQDEYPPRIERLIDFPKYKKAVSDIKARICTLAESAGIPEPVIASKKQINDLLKWCWFTFCDFDVRELRPDLLSGWRRELLLDDLASLFDDNEGEYNAVRSL
ncbi:ribonuclease D [Agaribacter marinus]|uniref:Ribonuclease D n=1 Tax=Agaribacter marinus TaxID=1431249 RepID=A0AA37STL3_9ALTE|nr:ribonuclease D [Agaribacter marinus]GLR69666.1 ribonuclease D [Agaribacter marinus]